MRDHWLDTWERDQDERTVVPINQDKVEPQTIASELARFTTLELLGEIYRRAQSRGGV